MDNRMSVKKIAERIAKVEGKRDQLAKFIKDVGQESDIVHKVKGKVPDDITIAAVDGGLLKKSFHGFDFTLVRAASACFSYKDRKISEVKYLPSKNPRPEPAVMEALSDLDWAYAASINRLLSETRIALKALEEFSPDFLLMDGSLAPHYADRPGKETGLYYKYNEVLSNYRKLYKRSVETGTALAGIIEDSRNTAFCNIIKRDIMSRINHQRVPELNKLLGKTRDTNLLYLILRKGERTSVFPYSESPDEHPVLKELKEHSGKLRCFYLKTAEHDRPIKVDTLSGDVDKLSSVLLAVSGQHSGYGLPAPIIEADNVAKLSESEMENFCSRVVKMIGSRPGIMKLRRDSRPF